MGKSIPKEFRTAAAFDIFERMGGICVKRDERKMICNGKSANMPSGRTVNWHWMVYTASTFSRTAKELRAATLECI